MSQLGWFILFLSVLIGLPVYLLWIWFSRFQARRREPSQSLQDLLSPTGQPLHTYQPQEIPGPVVSLDQDQSVSRVAGLLFAAALFLYLMTRLVGLERFPIYFFADEAAQTVLAADLVADQFHHRGVFLPTYFFNVDKFSLSVSVYWQVVPYLLFGKSILVTRGAAVLGTLLAVFAVGLILKLIFRTPYWWAGAILLSITPAWFLHSRTAFETTLATSFYAVYLFGYLGYLHLSPRYLYMALVAGALSFYTYSPARFVILLTSVLFLLADVRFHWQHRWVLRRSLPLLAILVLPYFRFQGSYLLADQDQIFLLDSYWVQDLPLSQKLIRYGSEYLSALNPGYWFFPHDRDLVRHVMKGYGHIWWATLPFVLVGLGIALRNWREPAYRTLLLAWLAAPAGGALVEVLITRVLFLIIPATVITAIGIAKVVDLLEHRWIHRHGAAIGLFVVLGIGNIFMLQDALTNGPTWFDNFGLYGMQYGAPQIFEVVEAYRGRDPERQIIISPRWTNGPWMILRFFQEDLEAIRWGAIDDDLAFNDPIDEDALYVMTPEEFQLAESSARITAIQVDQVIQYPDNRPGFYIASVQAKPP